MIRNRPTAAADPLPRLGTILHRMAIDGHIPGKKNSKMIARRGNRPIIITDPEIQRQIKPLLLSAKTQRPREPFTGVGVVMRFRVRDGRGDLDNKVATVWDVLKEAGVVVNDSIAHVRYLSASAIVAQAGEAERVEIEVVQR